MGAQDWLIIVVTTVTGDGRSGPPVSGSWPSTSAVWPQPVCPPQVRAMRLSFVGELGWELHIPRPSCVPVYRAVMAAGAKHGLVPAGYRAIDNLSIEKGGHGVQAALVGLPVPPPSPPPTLSISWNPSLPASQAWPGAGTSTPCTPGGA